jgi:hypothetical protein
MKQGASWQLQRSSAIHILWTPKFYYIVQNNKLLVRRPKPNISSLSPPIVFKFRFNIIPNLDLGPSSCLFLSGLSTKTIQAIFLTSIRATRTAYLIILDLITLRFCSYVT